MALLTETEVRVRAQQMEGLYKSTAGQILSETRKADERFDVFLSHSSAEPEQILLGVKNYLEDEGLSVYVDKYTDPQMSPNKVTEETAEVLRHRLRASRSLLYVYSRYSQSSRWMPWELGFMDGADKRIGIVPVAQVTQSSFEGEEYLGLYPYVDQATIKGTRVEKLWINRTRTYYTPLYEWIRGTSEMEQHT